MQTNEPNEIICKYIITSEKHEMTGWKGLLISHSFKNYIPLPTQKKRIRAGGEERQFSLSCPRFKPWVHHLVPCVRALFPLLWTVFPHVQAPFPREWVIFPCMGSLSWVPDPLARIKTRKSTKMEKIKYFAILTCHNLGTSMRTYKTYF